MSNESRIAALVANKDAILVAVEAMKAENAYRIHRGETIAYNGDSFNGQSGAIMEIAIELRNL